MDVWTLEQKYKIQGAELRVLEERICYIEEYLSKVTEDNNETVQGKEDKSPSVRSRRRTTKKSKSSK